MIVKIKKNKYVNINYIVSLEIEYKVVKVTTIDEVIKVEFESIEEANNFIIRIKKSSEAVPIKLGTIAKVLGFARAHL